MTTREVIFPKDRHALYDEHGYSPAVRAGDMVFVSGQVGSRADGTPEPDFEAQVRLAFTNLVAILEAAGGSLEHVVDVTTFHTDPQQQFPAILKVKADYFGEPPYPTWTAVGVTWLSGFDFEIKVVARIPEGGRK